MFVFQIDLYQLRVIKTPQLSHSPSKQRHAQSPPLTAVHMALFMQGTQDENQIYGGKLQALCEQRDKCMYIPA